MSDDNWTKHAQVTSIRPQGRGFSVKFGARKFRDLSDGQFPVDLWRIDITESGEKRELLARTVTKFSTLQRGKEAAAAGWWALAVDSWVELRTPKSRLPPEAP